ncbi:MAG: hypothetical protein AAGF79_16480 [Pseudomonadota bacterium]
MIITIGDHVTPLIVSAYGAGSAVWIYFTLKLGYTVIKGPRSRISCYAILSYSFALLFASARILLFVAYFFGDRTNMEIFPIVYGSIIWIIFWLHLMVGEYVSAWVKS